MINVADPSSAKVTIDSEIAADVIVIDDEPPSKRPRLESDKQDQLNDMVVDISSEEETVSITCLASMLSIEGDCDSELCKS